MQRQLVLDTETTGLDPAQGHRIIEIGCVELLNRRLTENRFHCYLNPDRAIDPAAVEVHGISNAFLADKPRFAEIAADFLQFVEGAELIIHNAPFDTGFIDHEMRRWQARWDGIATHCEIRDTLTLARQRHPGQRNTLDMLCKRYAIDNTQRTLHGALLDAELLSRVYLAMTGGQVTMSLETSAVQTEAAVTTRRAATANRPALRVIKASAEEETAHRRYLDVLDEGSDGACVWKTLG